MAFREPSRGQCYPAAGPIPLDRGGRIAGAARLEPACGAEQRRQVPMPEVQYRHEDVSDHSAPLALMSARICDIELSRCLGADIHLLAFEGPDVGTGALGLDRATRPPVDRAELDPCLRIRDASASSESAMPRLSSCEAPDRAITTMSTSPGRLPRRRRNHSRTPRFRRLRTTAFPTRRLALIPTRRLPGAQPGPGVATSITKVFPATRRPVREIRRKSRESRRRSGRENRPVSRLTVT